MVIFKGFTDENTHHLAIVNDEKDEARKGTHFIVRKSLLRPEITDLPTEKENIPMTLHEEKVGITASETKVYSLKSSMTTYTAHQFPSLGRRIIQNSVRWVSPIVKMFGEFSFIPGYWEWTEDILARFNERLQNQTFYPAICASLYSYDKESTILRAFMESWCPSTNSLHTLAGELSISLWDLHKLGGLPISGEIYDETIPSLHILTNCDDAGNRFLPRACELLFSAYHHLLKSNKRGVTARAWIDFWCGARRVYTAPSKRNKDKDYFPDHRDNPRGKIKAPPTAWNDHEESTFTLLDVVNENRKEMTYLAAFLSCWLCVFVLPESEHRLIRPGTFEIATRMAKGMEFSLAIPVLGSIYRGLNRISISDKPANTKCFFPAHFLYGWLAFYFSTHFRLDKILLGPQMVMYSGAHGAKYFTNEAARKLIHEGYRANVGCTISDRNNNELLTDDGDLPSLKLQYLISIRSGYLPLRLGKDFHVEPYMPFRFSRQFGFCQDVEGILSRNVGNRDANFSQALRYWKLLLCTGSQSRVLAPAFSSKWQGLVTRHFHNWWPKKTVQDLKDGVHLLRASIDPPKPRKTAQTPQGNTKLPCKRILPADEVSTSGGKSDVNFKHVKTDTNKAVKKKMVDHLTDVDNFFNGIPSSDAPIDPNVVLFLLQIY